MKFTCAAILLILLASLAGAQWLSVVGGAQGSATFNFGYPIAGASSNTFANFFQGVAYDTPNEPITISGLYACVWGTGSHHVRMAIYTEASTVPGSLVAGTDTGSLTVTQTTKPASLATWTGVTFAPVTLAANTRYYIALNLDNAGINYAYVTGRVDWYLAETYSLFPPSSVGGGQNPANIMISMYAVAKAAWLPKYWVQAVGDSITMGFGLSSPSTQNYAVVGLGGLPYVLKNYGVAGETCATMVTNSALPGGYFAFQMNKDNGVYQYPLITLMCGINDLIASASAATIEGRISTLVTNAHAAGAKMVVGTILPCQSAGCNTANGGQNPSGPLELARLAINAWILAGSSGADAVFDAGGNATIGPYAAALNGTYYQSDAVHPTAAGAVIVAGLYRAAIVTLDP